MSLRDLISAEYLDQQRGLHAQGRYGRKGGQWASAAIDLIRGYKCDTVLDYGCGQGRLANELLLFGIEINEYDPAIPGKDRMPKAADLVMCTDVLEHIEENKIDNVLAHIRSVTRKVAFFVIHMQPASKNLPDGRNAHILLRDSLWWYTALHAAGFSVIEAHETKKHIVYTCR